MGDVKYSFFMGFFLGFPKALVSFYLAFLTGSAVSVILIITGRKKMKSTVAFGPFLAFATAVSYLYGDLILSVYNSLFV
jgi:leader peptidase (prepilin peptidase)/N-methyltransferase